MTQRWWRAGMMALLLTWPVQGQAGAGGATTPPAGGQSVVARFLAAEVAPLDSYRAIRHLEAATRDGRWRASMDVLTELDPAQGFRYTVLRESGSGVIRKRVFLKALEAERDARKPAEAVRGALTDLNYEFVPDGTTENGLERVLLKPKRNDALLVTGQMLVTPDEADLVEVDGRLVKRPSFWTRRVAVVRRWARVEGVRVPVLMQSTAEVLVAGMSTFHMSYEYESVNGVLVGRTGEAPSAPTRHAAGREP